MEPPAHPPNPNPPNPPGPDSARPGEEGERATRAGGAPPQSGSGTWEGGGRRTAADRSGDASPGPEASVLVGAGRYRAIRELARGAMGVVYLAHDDRLDRPVALKLALPASFAGNQTRVSRFVREARAVARLQHPGIVQVHDVGEHAGTLFMVMDLVEGEPLSDLIAREGPLDQERAAGLALQLAEALHYAHSRGVLHRDVKPDNILMEAGATPKLTDFGLAKRTDFAEQELAPSLSTPADELDHELTADGQVLGTPAYMPPEQAHGNVEHDARADVYSLGVTLYEMLTGRLPFEGDTLVEILSAVVCAPPPAPSEFLAGIDPALERICLRCLEKEPEGRYASAEELAEALDRYLRRRSQRRKLAWAAVCAALLALAAGAVWATTRSPADTRGDVPATTKVGEGEQETSGGAQAPSAGVAIELDRPGPGLITATKDLEVGGHVVAGNPASVWIDGRGIPIRNGLFATRLVLPDGRHTIRVLAGPSAAELAAVEVVVDRVVPKITIESPKAEAIISGETVELRGRVADPNLSEVCVGGEAVAVAAGGSFQRAIPVREGRGTVEVTARDGAGNWTSARVVVVVDRTPPRVEIEAPKPDAIAGAGALRVQGRVVDLLPGEVKVNGSVAPIDSRGAFHAEISPTEDTSLEVRIEASDRAGHAAPPVVLRLARDVVPPTLSLQAPPEDFLTQAAKVTVRGRVDDEHPPAHVELRAGADTKPVELPVQSDGRFEGSIAIGEGLTQVVVSCADRAGNQAHLERALRRDSVPPALTLPGDGVLDHWGKRQLEVTGSVAETGCGVTVAGEPAAVTDSAFRAKVKLKRGLNEFAVVATDAAGNATSATLTVHYHPGRQPTVPEGTWWEPTREQLVYAGKEGLPLWFEHPTGLRFVLIPPGSFERGEGDARHTVHIRRGFYVSATEVTNAQFRLFHAKHASGSYQNGGETADLNADPLPAARVGYPDAVAFCAWLGGRKSPFRLPTEAEWEYACRAGTSTRFFWGDDPAKASAFANGLEGITKKKFNLPEAGFPEPDPARATLKVGSLKPNAWGLQDMLGNVAEWCADWHGPLPRRDVRDPTGPSKGTKRVTRGGAFLHGPGPCSSAARGSLAMTARDPTVGVRVVAMRPHRGR